MRHALIIPTNFWAAEPILEFLFVRPSSVAGGARDLWIPTVNEVFSKIGVELVRFDLRSEQIQQLVLRISTFRSTAIATETWLIARVQMRGNIYARSRRSGGVGGSVGILLIRQACSQGGASEGLCCAIGTGSRPRRRYQSSSWYISRAEFMREQSIGRSISIVAIQHTNHHSHLLVQHLVRSGRLRCSHFPLLQKQNWKRTMKACCNLRDDVELQNWGRCNEDCGLVDML